MMSKPKKARDKKPWLTLFLLSLLFYGAMLFLTVTAKDIHNARLPQVTAERPGKQKFSYTIITEDLTMERTSSFTALPKDMVDSNKVFFLQSEVRNDFTYYYARHLTVTIDDTMENPDYYAISDGLSLWSGSIIMTGYETLQDGDEVHLIKEEKKKAQTVEDLFQ